MTGRWKSTWAISRPPGDGGVFLGIWLPGIADEGPSSPPSGQGVNIAPANVFARAGKRPSRERPLLPPDLPAVKREQIEQGIAGSVRPTRTPFIRLIIEGSQEVPLW